MAQSSTGRTVAVYYRQFIKGTTSLIANLPLPTSPSFNKENLFRKCQSENPQGFSQAAGKRGAQIVTFMKTSKSANILVKEYYSALVTQTINGLLKTYSCLKSSFPHVINIFKSSDSASFAAKFRP